MNLELPDDRRPFDQFTNLDTLIQTLFFIKNKHVSDKNQTLIFIDEIQAAPNALNLLRYFYESEPEIAVIAAGSMLETVFNKHVNFPVGRVEYKVLRPVSFPEFLNAINEPAAIDELQKIPLNGYAYNKLLKLFHTYAIIGRMPEIVSQYSIHKDLTALAPIYDSLLNSYLEDVEKYAASNAEIKHLRHAIRAAFLLASKRIKFEGFGNSAYGSREMGEALRTLEKTFLLQLIYPSTEIKLPYLPNIKKSPRLQVLDTGLYNYNTGIQKEILGTDDLNKIQQGTIIEHLIGQELLATQFNALSHLNFWTREKNTSSAEIDYVYIFEGQLIPIEVKSGAQGTLKSLHLFMDDAPHKMAIRFYAGELKITESATPASKKYRLLNLPYFLASQIEPYLKWFEKKVK